MLEWRRHDWVYDSSLKFLSIIYSDSTHKVSLFHLSTIVVIHFYDLIQTDLIQSVLTNKIRVAMQIDQLWFLIHFKSVRLIDPLGPVHTR
jgi:hypothetical protein